MVYIFSIGCSVQKTQQDMKISNNIKKHEEVFGNPKARENLYLDSKKSCSKMTKTKKKMINEFSKDSLCDVTETSKLIASNKPKIIQSNKIMFINEDRLKAIINE